jgi:hypothetical protein
MGRCACAAHHVHATSLKEGRNSGELGVGGNRQRGVDIGEYRSSIEDYYKLVDSMYWRINLSARLLGVGRLDVTGSQ